MLRSLGCAVTAVVVSTVGGASLGAASSGSGLRGLVTKSPTRPVCIAGKPCSAPAPGVKLIFTGTSVTRTVVTDARGRYAIGLSPGRYIVAARGAKFGLRPGTVTVTAGQFKTLNLVIDTGIR